MATTARANVDHDGSHSMSHGPVPGSPTLTNPDMILPDYDVPDSPRDRRQSPLELWNDPNIGRMDFQLPPQNYGSAPVGPHTPIIYGNGTMLSDIGEVTEVESTIGPNSRRTSSRYSMRTDDGETYGSSAIAKANYRASKILARQRSASVGSNSTITTQDHRTNMPDFDDSVSVGDSSFQGDDEESMASFYVEGAAPRKSHTKGPVQTSQETGDEPYSTTYISERAERILANAKRRLTAMEGNLTRARSSLAYSPNSDGSTPSPTVGHHGSHARDGAPVTNHYHSRIRSEDGTRDITKPSPFPQRSASALGSAGGYRPIIPGSSRHDIGAPRGYSASHKMTSQPLELTLEPLGEDDQDGEDDYSPNERVQDGYLSPTFSTSGMSDRPLSRSASAAQMRDIHDQMQGLKGKISSLKEQARADSLKRRSLQSLRTPSPFTHARWEQGMMEPQEIRGFHSGPESVKTPRQSVDFGVAENITHGMGTIDQRPSKTEEEKGAFMDSPIDELAAPHDAAAATPNNPMVARNGIENNRPQTPPPRIEEETRIENGDVDDADYDGDDKDVGSQADVLDWESESGDSLYHDSHQHQVSHEDREDAFDYEHFFLHSAMGSMSRQSSRRRRDSFGSSGSGSSEDSVETTRGPVEDTPRKRRSMDTAASDDSFETATEGRASRSSAFEADRSDYGFPITNDGQEDEVPSLPTEGMDQGIERRQRQNSVLYRPTSATSASRLHRPSVSSFESTGTNRSFPLVNKTKVNGGVLTPGESPDPALAQVSESLMHETTSIMEGERGEVHSSTAQLQDLSREDQIAVERLVATLGKCVLALGESSRAGAEARLQRRRIDAARRILEGLDEP